MESDGLLSEVLHSTEEFFSGITAGVSERWDVFEKSVNRWFFVDYGVEFEYGPNANADHVPHEAKVVLGEIAQKAEVESITIQVRRGMPRIKPELCSIILRVMAPHLSMLCMQIPETRSLMLMKPKRQLANQTPK